MCGIIGMVTPDAFELKELVRGLKRLEYRGYDSCGYATMDGTVVKMTGGVDGLLAAVGGATRLAIAHTRWATHGGISERNAHPHWSQDVFVVHNGIIDNYEALKARLGVRSYASETDSEVIAHFLADRLSKGASPQKAMREFMVAAEGTFAVLWFRKDASVLYAMKRDSPLAVGFADDRYIVASDLYAFSGHTDQAVFFEDNEYAVITAKKASFHSLSGDVVKTPQTFSWSSHEETKESFDHYMHKEIYEEPRAVERLLISLATTQAERLAEVARLVADAKRVTFLACGTSYHAALIGSFLCKQLDIDSHAVIASEFEHFLSVGKDTLVIAISQSGETMDVLTVLKNAKQRGATVASMVNVPYSTVQRLSDASLEILAGQEVCVAATKSYTNQLVALFCLARELGGNSIEMDLIASRIQETIRENEPRVMKLAHELKDRNDIFVLGRGISYPTAREIALKLKEIPYMHAEGMMAGELKHGTLALIEKGTPVISLIPNNSADMLSSTKEVEARGARTIVISNTGGELSVPSCSDAEFSVYSAVVGHLLAYHIAKLRGCAIDKPRNLAKSVTVK